MGNIVFSNAVAGYYSIKIKFRLNIYVLYARVLLVLFIFEFLSAFWTFGFFTKQIKLHVPVQVDKAIIKSITSSIDYERQRVKVVIEESIRGYSKLTTSPRNKIGASIKRAQGTAT